MGMVIKRFDVYLINLDPVVGTEMQKTRPGVILSPNELNKSLGTVIIAPLTKKIAYFQTRIKCKFQKKEGVIALDHLRSVDKTRLLKRIGKIDAVTQNQILTALSELFSK